MKVSELATGNLHHAYLVVGGAEEGLKEVHAVLEKRGVHIPGNLDVLSISVPELDIDTVREVLYPFISLTPLGEAKYLVLSFSRANHSSQNALLKVVEEGSGRTNFFLCVDAVGHVLPTLRSRTIVVNTDVEHVTNTDEKKEAEEFLAGSFADRLETVESFAKTISKTQDRAPVRAFVRELLIRAYAQAFPAPALKDLVQADQYLRLQGASPKAILGHLAVSLPKKRV